MYARSSSLSWELFGMDDIPKALDNVSVRTSEGKPNQLKTQKEKCCLIQEFIKCHWKLVFPHPSVLHSFVVESNIRFRRITVRRTRLPSCEVQVQWKRAHLFLSADPTKYNCISFVHIGLFIYPRSMWHSVGPLWVKILGMESTLLRTCGLREKEELSSCPDEILCLVI